MWLDIDHTNGKRWGCALEGPAGAPMPACPPGPGAMNGVAASPAGQRLWCGAEQGGHAAGGAPCCHAALPPCHPAMPPYHATRGTLLLTLSGLGRWPRGALPCRPPCHPA